VSDQPSGDRVVVITTGGTFEKTYDPHTGTLANHASVLDTVLASLELPGLTIDRVALMNVDSLDMTGDDHLTIAHRARTEAARPGVDGVVVIHGTDRLTDSGDATAAAGVPEKPIVFTGAFRPFTMRDSDAAQNLAEALFAARTLDRGVYVVMHGRALGFPGPRKDPEGLMFVP